MTVQAQGTAKRSVVGITQDLRGANLRWKAKYPDLRHWNVISVHHTKSDAEGKRDVLARAWSHDKLPEEEGADFSTWHVYVFTHGGKEAENVSGIRGRQ